MKINHRNGHANKNRSRLFGCLLGAALLSAALPASAAADTGETARQTDAALPVPEPVGQTDAAGQADTALPVSEPLSVCGILRREGERILMTDIHGDTVLDELVLNISDETRILDAVNGFPVAKDSLKEGETAYAYISQAMALSLPPQSHAELILCQIPEDAPVPRYETAKRLERQADSTFLLTTVRGNQYLLDSSTVLLPYLTKNIVTAEDLTQGRTCLIWTDGEKLLTQEHADAVRAEKAVLFAPSANQGKPSGPASDPELTGKMQLR